MITNDKNKRPPLVLSGKTVTRFFPKDLRYTMQDHSVRTFKAGVQEVPEEIADTPWMVDNGVVEYVKGTPLPALMRKAPPGSQAYAASIGGSGVYDAVTAPRQHSEIDPVAEADQAEQDVRTAEANLESLRDRAAALRDVADKHVDRQAELDRQRGVPANTGEGAASGENSGQSEDDDDDGQDGTEDARPVEGDINPKTGNPYTENALKKAQDKWDEKHVE